MSECCKVIWKKSCDNLGLPVKGVWFQAMGAQNTKERTVSAGTHSIRTTRNRPRPVKDGRQTVSNIFTEHSGMNHLFLFILSYFEQQYT